jgi:hypothetical protein
MFKAQAFFTSKRMVLFFMLLTISACTTQTATITPELQKLRITNSSNIDITGLVVLFPGPSWDSEASRVEFGNIPAGQTSEYRDIPSGVYRWAAYEYTLDGLIVNQSVTDWVGENPMAGKKFTYQIVLDPKKVEGDQVTLVTVLIDEP